MPTPLLGAWIWWLLVAAHLLPCMAGQLPDILPGFLSVLLRTTITLWSADGALSCTTRCSLSGAPANPCTQPGLPASRPPACLRGLGSRAGHPGNGNRFLLLVTCWLVAPVQTLGASPSWSDTVNNAVFENNQQSQPPSHQSEAPTSLFQHRRTNQASPHNDQAMYQPTE